MSKSASPEGDPLPCFFDGATAADASASLDVGNLSPRLSLYPRRLSSSYPRIATILSLPPGGGGEVEDAVRMPRLKIDASEWGAANGTVPEAAAPAGPAAI